MDDEIRNAIEHIVQEIGADFEDNRALLDTSMKLGTNIELDHLSNY